MTSLELARKIDHTVLKPEATEADVRKVCGEAREHHFASVCISPIFVPLAARELKGSDVLVCTVSGFPNGTSKATVKAIESSSAVKDGANEVDMVAHLPYLASGNLDAARAEMMEVAKACRAANPNTTVKVIVESAYLLTLGAERAEKAIAIACQAVRESGCDFIKTSTGFHPAGGSSLEQVRLMKKYSQGIKIKASGGIRDFATAKAMIDAGADRLGLSSSIAVVQGLTATGSY